AARDAANAGTCRQYVMEAKTRLEATLANPQALQAQAQKLSAELPTHRANLHSGLVSFVTRGHSLAKALLGRTAVPPDFSTQVQELKKNIDAVQAAYAYFLGRGEEKELSTVASKMATA